MGYIFIIGRMLTSLFLVSQKAERRTNDRRETEITNVDLFRFLTICASKKPEQD